MKKLVFFRNTFHLFISDNNTLPEFNRNCNNTLGAFTCNVRHIINLKVISKLKNSSSPGPDGYSVYFLKKILAHIANPLCKWYKKSLSESTMPDEWKKALIVPLHKKGDRHYISNYRPISLTSIKQGIGENCPITTIRLSVKNSIVKKNQHGFVPKKSTVTNLLVCLNDWTCNFDSNIPTDVVYLDYSKCFDKVCHEKLSYKLSRYGFTGSAWNWIKAFLVNIVQGVKVCSV